MHFSRIVDGFARDLELTFGQPLATQWEEEHFGLIEAPPDLPKCSDERFVHPTLIIENSIWAQRYADRWYSSDDPNGAGIKHYFLLSLNDRLHVLAHGDPVARWIEPVDAGHPSA